MLKNYSEVKIKKDRIRKKLQKNIGLVPAYYYLANNT